MLARRPPLPGSDFGYLEAPYVQVDDFKKANRKATSWRRAAAMRERALKRRVPSGSNALVIASMRPREISDARLRGLPAQRMRTVV